MELVLHDQKVDRFASHAVFGDYFVKTVVARYERIWIISQVDMVFFDNFAQKVEFAFLYRLEHVVAICTVVEE